MKGPSAAPPEHLHANTHPPQDTPAHYPSAQSNRTITSTHHNITPHQHATLAHAITLPQLLNPNGPANRAKQRRDPHGVRGHSYNHREPRLPTVLGYTLMIHLSLSGQRGLAGRAGCISCRTGYTEPLSRDSGKPENVPLRDHRNS